MMLDILRRETVYLWYYFSLQLEQIFGYWVLGMVLGSVIAVFAKDHIHGLFRSMHGKRLGVAGIFAASTLGIASPLCMYGTIPLAASFSESGMEDDWLAAFMMSSILLNPQLILYSMALGRTALAIRIISSFFCGVAVGLLLRRFYRKKAFFNFDGFSAPQSRDTDPNLLIRFLKNLGRNIRATGTMFLLGVVLSALFQLFIGFLIPRRACLKPQTSVFVMSIPAPPYIPSWLVSGIKVRVTSVSSDKTLAFSTASAQKASWQE